MSLAGPQPLVLASQSKVRRALLEAAGIPVEARPAHLDERAIEERVQGGPGEVALTLAREKARTVAAMSDRLAGRRLRPDPGAR